jgi:hypothetical protein
MLAVGAPSCHAVALILTHLGSVAQQHATRKVSHRLPTAHHVTEILSSATLVRSEIVRDGCDNGGVIETQVIPRQAMGHWSRPMRHAIVTCNDAGLPAHVRDIESVSRMVYSVMLDTVAD